LEAAGEGRYVSQRRLDPFDTSMRDFDDVSAHLSQIKAGQALDNRDPTQRMRDLRSAGLADGTVENAHLTPLGEATLKSWIDYGVATDSKIDDLARILLLLISARGINAGLYRDFQAYWAELRASFPAPKLIHSWDILYLLNYLDHDIDGYAPGSAYRDMGTPFDEIEYDLDRFADEIGTSNAAKRGAQKVGRAIADKSPRGRGRATFCIAMELLAETNVTPRLILEAFGYPDRPREWTPLNDGQISKIETILDAHGFRPKPGTGLDGLDEVAALAGRPPYELPGEIDFAGALQEPPKPAKKAGAPRGKGAKKIDYNQKQKRNDFVGNLGEKFAHRYELWRLRDHDDLRNKVSHVSTEDDTLGYDIISWETDGTKRLVEVKSTQGPLETRFFISANELACAEANPDTYVILRVGNLKGQPICCELRYPFDELDIEPSVFEVAFKPA
jgi:hypothetical protein